MSTSDVIPFCITRWIDGDIQALIQIPLREKGGVYRCPDGADIFYAFSPMQIPLPVGMSMFCALRKSDYPYGTKSIEWVYDSFNLKNEGDTNCTLFTTYTHPAPGLVPLYIYKNSKTVVPSFSPTPPTKDWMSTLNSPIYVMTPASIGLEPSDLGSLRFRCVEGRCLPDTIGLKNVYGVGTESLPFEKCVSVCDDLIQDHSFSPTSTWQNIIAEQSAIVNSSNSSNVSRRKHRYLIVVFFLIVLAIAMVTVVYLCMRV